MVLNIYRFEYINLFCKSAEGSAAKSAAAALRKAQQPRVDDDDEDDEAYNLPRRLPVEPPSPINLVDDNGNEVVEDTEQGEALV